jgi:two-component system phosphate regulon response regulator PhoB
LPLTSSERYRLSARILVVEDDAAIQALIAAALRGAGYVEVRARSAEEAQDRLRESLPDAVILDWMLPGASGLALARRLRQDARTRGLPIIMVTARADEPDKVAGLEQGADDYLTKPFSPRELVARLRALLRRSAPEHSGQPVELAGVRVDPASHRASAAGRTIELGPTEFRLLRFLIAHPERVYSRSQLLDQVWGDDRFIEERTVDVCVRRLRKALEDAGAVPIVETVRGVGYRCTARPGEPAD